MTSAAFDIKLASFDDFIKLANFFYITIGIEPYGREEPSKIKSVFYTVLFYASIINFNCMMMGEIGFVVAAVAKKENFLAATMTMSYIGCSLVSNCKMVYVYSRKNELTKFIQGLQQLFPKTLKLQKEYNVPYYLGMCKRVTMSFSTLYMILIWTYNLFSVIQYFIYEVCFSIRRVEVTLPYFIFPLWDWNNHWSFYLLYILQDLAGYTSGTAQIASDLLLIACVIQVIMHFDFISRKLATYQVKGPAKADFQQDLEFCRNIVKYHNKLLDLSAQLNHIFGIPLFLNFAASSFVICFVGFQITLGASAETIVTLVLFIISSVAQVYMICHYGQQLKDASTKVAQAVFEHNWFMADTRYSKMLVIIAARAQQPVILKATTFVSVSRETITQIMQLSYKFFAVLRTMYGEK